MKILIVGGEGTIGSSLASYFSQKNELIIAGRKSGDIHVDITNSESIENLLKKTGAVDAIICAAGEAKWAPFGELSEEDFYIGMKSKLMGQINMVRFGLSYINPGGSITLTSGILADDPVPMSSSPALVNGALHSFVKAVVLDIKKDVRINVVSSGLVLDALERYSDYFPGHHPIPMEKMIRGYIRSVEGKVNGEIIRIYD